MPKKKKSEEQQEDAPVIKSRWITLTGRGIKYLIALILIATICAVCIFNIEYDSKNGLRFKRVPLKIDVKRNADK